MMSGEEAAHHWVQTFVNQCKTGTHAELRLFCEGGHLKVTMCADLGQLVANTGTSSNCWGVPRPSPSRVRRRERRAAERAVAEEEAAAKAAAEKADAEKAAAEQAAAEKVYAEKVAAEKAAAEKASAEKAAAETAATEKAAAEKAAAEKAAAEKAAADKAAAEKAAAEKATAERAAKEEAAAEKASTSCCGSEQQKPPMSCWSCDEMFATDDQGYIPEHNCVQTPPVHSPKSVRPGPKPPMVLKKPVRMLDGSPAWSSRPK